MHIRGIKAAFTLISNDTFMRQTLHPASRSSRFIGATIVLLLSATVIQAQQTLSRSDRDRDITLDAGQRRAVIEGATRALATGYFDVAVGNSMASAVLDRQRRGEYDAIVSASELADSLTSHFRAVSHDKHVGVDFSADVLPRFVASEKPGPDLIERRKRNGTLNNYGLERAERLGGNVGYLKVNGFFDAALGGETAANAMAFLSNTEALIIDLRENHGGSPGMVALLATYLFAGDPVHLNDIWQREGNVTMQWHTLPYVPGQRYVDKPVYVLTSAQTISAGEEFANDLKVLKRATLVGETTAGGANPGSTQRINDHFSVFVPTGRAINPVTKTNWEGTGVVPDVRVAADSALGVAHVLALEAILKRNPDAALERQATRALSVLRGSSR
jgi:retinol-binding protein 3